MSSRQARLERALQGSLVYAQAVSAACFSVVEPRDIGAEQSGQQEQLLVPCSGLLHKLPLSAMGNNSPWRPMEMMPNWQWLLEPQMLTEIVQLHPQPCTLRSNTVPQILSAHYCWLIAPMYTHCFFIILGVITRCFSVSLEMFSCGTL